MATSHRESSSCSIAGDSQWEFVQFSSKASDVFPGKNETKWSYPTGNLSTRSLRFPVGFCSIKQQNKRFSLSPSPVDIYRMRKMLFWRLLLRLRYGVLHEKRVWLRTKNDDRIGKNKPRSSASCHFAPIQKKSTSGKKYYFFDVN